MYACMYVCRTHQTPAHPDTRIPPESGSAQINTKTMRTHVTVLLPFPVAMRAIPTLPTCLSDGSLVESRLILITRTPARPRLV